MQFADDSQSIEWINSLERDWEASQTTKYIGLGTGSSVLTLLCIIALWLFRSKKCASLQSPHPRQSSPQPRESTAQPRNNPVTLEDIHEGKVVYSTKTTNEQDAMPKEVSFMQPSELYEACSDQT